MVGSDKCTFMFTFMGTNSTTNGRKWITNGVENKMIYPNELLPFGWKYGQTKKKKQDKYLNNSLHRRDTN